MKVGIVTHYYNSTNYGACLQAYALCKVLEELGAEPEQIRIDYAEDCRNLLDPLEPVKRLIPGKETLKRLLKPGYRRQLAQKEQYRRALRGAFAHFTDDLTPHSDRVYTRRTIPGAGERYDAFITGSDQVFNPLWYFPPFFLDFVPAGKPKLSYAASIAQRELSPAVKKRYRKHLEGFTAVSLREKSALPLLAEVCPAQWVLDPTLLLSPEQWSAVAAPRQVEAPYLFCYFLGDDPHVRQAAADYGKARGLQVVTVPNAAGMVHRHDGDFGDIRLPDPSPEAFLSLIRHSHFVLTDSFHASVFSLIFGREFLAVPRKGHQAMGTRLADLTELFEVPERFYSREEPVTAETLAALSPLDSSRPQTKFQTERSRSLAFLRSGLGLTEE